MPVEDLGIRYAFMTYSKETRKEHKYLILLDKNFFKKTSLQRGNLGILCSVFGSNY